MALHHSSSFGLSMNFSHASQFFSFSLHRSKSSIDAGCGTTKAMADKYGA